jgi:hypothetical protein
MEQITIEKKTQKELYLDLAWLYEATSDDETRYFMKDMLHVETEQDKKILVTTDGRRLHLLRTEDKVFEDGDYDMEKRADYITLSKRPETGEGSIAFPNWREVVPEQTAELYKGISVNKKDMASCLYPLYNIGINVAVEYIEALSGWEWDIFIATHKQPVTSNCLIFTSVLKNEKMAMIMPRNGDKKTGAARETLAKLYKPENHRETEKTLVFIKPNKELKKEAEALEDTLSETVPDIGDQVIVCNGENAYAGEVKTIIHGEAYMPAEQVRYEVMLENGMTAVFEDGDVLKRETQAKQPAAKKKSWKAA